jgi:ferric-dicitrate binding protein FerR (iron transport regulator)
MEELVAKYLEGITTGEENEEIEKWREVNPEEFFQLKKIWTLSAKISPSDEHIHEVFRTETKSIPMSRTWLKYAATVIFVIAAISTYWYLNQTSGSQNIDTRRLADGSKITLYKNSVLTEIMSDNTRTVELEGRAYFDVQPDEAKPFIIKTEEALIQVIGTSFTVNTEKTNTTEVIVESGIVEFGQNPETFGGQLNKIKLRPGEVGLVTANARGIIKRNNRDENYMAWANQVLTFKSQKLSEVAKLIEDVYTYDVIFSNEELRNCKLTATYKKKSPEQIARLIADTFELEYSIDGNRITFSGEACN